MSTLSVDTITDASGGTTASINGYTPTASNMAGKNRIINGAMMISQRGVSPTITGAGDYSVDRFYNYYSGNAYTSVQSSTAPAGFVNSLLLTVTTPSASPTYSFFGQRIEGFNCADLSWGTASAKTVTLSFWVRSSVTGVYSLAVGNGGGNRAYAVQYTINSADTWEQKTITIAGDTSGTWLTTNNNGIMLRWNMGTSSGSRLISAGSWQAADADGATGSTGANTWANTSGATFYLTGVQFEEGSTASQFSLAGGGQYGAELALCQRYYYKFNNSAGSAWANNNFTASGFKFNVTMRAQPSIDAGAAFSVNVGSAGTVGVFTGSPTGTDGNSIWIFNSASNWTVGAVVALSAGFSAEL